jgi:sodium/bile acid cotransporter 7
MSKLSDWLKREWFLLGMVLAVVFASTAPNVGKTDGTLHLDQVAHVGVAMIFFLHGLGISLNNLKQGLLQWRVHVLVQGFTFIVFPLVWLIADTLIGHYFPSFPAGLRLGFCYLCALPSTISSSVAMTGLARGNVPVAIFNATLSSLLGIVMTPLLLALLSGVSGTGMSLGQAVSNIAQLLLLPMIVGQLLRPVLHRWHVRFKHYTTLADRIVILLLVYAAFCDSVASGLWRDHGADVIVLAIVGSGLLLALVIVATTWCARRMQLPVADEISAVFCGSKKTLASGVPMAKLLFGAHPALGLIVLPIMMYHQLQLFVCSILASRYAARKEGEGRI